jgi:hypothetical protein
MRDGLLPAQKMRAFDANVNDAPAIPRATASLIGLRGQLGGGCSLTVAASFGGMA